MQGARHLLLPPKKAQEAERFRFWSAVRNVLARTLPDGETSRTPYRREASVGPEALA